MTTDWYDHNKRPTAYAYQNSEQEYEPRIKLLFFNNQWLTAKEVIKLQTTHLPKKWVVYHDHSQKLTHMNHFFIYFQ